MSYRNPDSPARQQYVDELVSDLSRGQEVKTPLRASQVRLCQDFRSALSRLYPGEFSTTTKKPDGYLWVKRL